MIENLTWTCHVCGRERPDAQISVHKSDVTPPGFPPGTIIRNVRYCNDRQDCVNGAPSVLFTERQ